MSHPLRMRGLKLPFYIVAPCGKCVASFTDAWIETIYTIRVCGVELSHPLRMRGLKHRLQSDLLEKRLSRILYGCVD